jgi:thiol:disulfide interchange protein
MADYRLRKPVCYEFTARARRLKGRMTMKSTTRNWLVGLCSVLALTAVIASANESRKSSTAVTAPNKGEQQTEAAQVQWNSDVQTAFDAANKANKLLLVDVGAPWCGWCRKMDESTYTDKTVAKALAKDFVCVKLNSDDNGPGSQFAQSLGINSLPTVLIIDPKTKKYSMNAGYLNPSDFISMMTQTKQQLAAISTKPSM